MTKPPEIQRSSVFLDMLLLPYHLLFTWWFDTITDRPSHSWFTKEFVRTFSDLLERRHLRVASNAWWENLLQYYLNAKAIRLTSPDVELHITYLVDEFELSVRPAGSKNKWRPLASVWPELANPEQSRSQLGIDLNHVSYVSMMNFMDDHWDQLIAALRN